MSLFVLAIDQANRFVSLLGSTTKQQARLAKQLGYGTRRPLAANTSTSTGVRGSCV